MWRRTRPDWSVAVVLAVATVCLIVDKSMATGVLRSIPDWDFSFGPARTLTWYVVIPAVTLAALGYNPLAYLGPGHWRRVIGMVAAGIVLMLVLAGGLLTLPAASSTYGTGPGGDALLRTFFVMLATEFFCRGFLLLPLVERFGWNGALIAAMPYGLLHVGKPLAEALGSIPYALALSYLAVRSGSVLYGVILHCVLAYGVTLWAHVLR